MRNVHGLLIAASILALTGCATPIPTVQDCALPPTLPKAVQDQADPQRPSYSERVRPLLDWLETLIGTARR